MEFLNLGSYEISGDGVNKFNLGLPPKNSQKNKYLTALLLWVEMKGIATGNGITKKQFLRETARLINLYINNKMIVDNMDCESLNRLCLFMNAYQFPDYQTPSVSETSEYDKTLLIQIPFSYGIMTDRFDFCKDISDITNISLEFQRGNINGLTKMIIKVVAIVEEREGKYKVPDVRLKKYTITKTISDNISIPNRVLAMFWQLPETGNLDDNVLIRSNDKVILDNLPLSELNSFINFPFIIDDLSKSDLNYLYITIPNQIPLSIKKPLFYERDNLFYDDLSLSNSPFNVIQVEILPNENLGEGQNILETRFSPVKVS
jgi:hypothetical protein